jgi:hypothetical protein
LIASFVVSTSSYAVTKGFKANIIQRSQDLHVLH